MLLREARCTLGHTLGTQALRTEGLRCETAHTCSGKRCLYLRLRLWRLHQSKWVAALAVLGAHCLLWRLLSKSTHIHLLGLRLETRLLELWLLHKLLRHWLPQSLLIVLNRVEKIDQRHGRRRLWWRHRCRRLIRCVRSRCRRRLSGRLARPICCLPSIPLRFFLGEVLPPVDLKVLIIEIVF